MTYMLKNMLKYYLNEDFSLQLNAKFVLVFTSTFLLAITVSAIYSTTLANSLEFIIIPLAILVLVIVSSLIILIKGKYILSINIIITTGFIITWFILFFEPASSLNKTNSIVYIIALLSATPFLLSKHRKFMLIYFSFNVLIFIGYSYYLDANKILSRSELVDYFIDNLIAIIFVFAVSYNLFSISQKLLERKEKDIIEKKRTAQALNNVRMLLHSIINAMPSIVIAIDRTYKVTHWNNEAEKCSGISQKEAEGLNLFSVFPQLPSFKENLEGVINEGTIFKRERLQIWNEREDQLKDIIMYPLGQNNIAGAVIRIDDISERIKMENMMLQSAKMITLGGLTAGMAHEINNPLAGMIQNSQLVLNRLTQANKVNQEIAADMGVDLNIIHTFNAKRNIPDLLEKITQLGYRIAKLVDDMLSFSSASNSPPLLRNIPEIIDKSIVLSKSDFELNQLYNFKNIRIERTYSPDLPEIKCSEAKMNQVFLNMIKNSTVAIYNRKYVKDEQPQITIRAEKEHEKIKIEFEDNGCGMPPEILNRIFEPFFTTMPVGKGPGLGLYISYFIITKNLAGSIEAESKPDVGTKFTIELPIN